MSQLAEPVYGPSSMDHGLSPFMFLENLTAQPIPGLLSTMNYHTFQ